MDIVLAFVQLIFGPGWPMNQLNETQTLPYLRLPISSDDVVEMLEIDCIPLASSSTPPRNMDVRSSRIYGQFLVEQKGYSNSKCDRMYG